VKLYLEFNVSIMGSLVVLFYLSKGLKYCQALFQLSFENVRDFEVNLDHLFSVN
jgi:hypothetical protein